MASGTYANTSLDWQLQLFQQQLGEWLERWLMQVIAPTAQPLSLPEDLLRTLFWFLVMGAAGWAGWQLYTLLRPYWNAYRRARSIAAPQRNQTLGDAERSPEVWLQQARAAQRQGNYRDACRALYMALLQHLGDRELIRQDSSRTDGEYLYLVHHLVGFQAYEQLIRTHERLCFSEAAISAEEFDRCWQAYQEICRT